MACFLNLFTYLLTYLLFVLKRSLSAHLMQVKLFFVTFNLHCRLHKVSVRKLSERLSNFWMI